MIGEIPSQSRRVELLSPVVTQCTNRRGPLKIQEVGEKWREGEESR